jgi:uncharacterized membrane-anchored protein YhcB (DUF1043 family)
MKKVALVAGLVMFYLVSILVASNLSAKSALKSQWGTFETHLDKMQSELALRHLLRYRELQSNLEQGCKGVVLEKLKISAAIESTLISSSLERQKTSELSEFIAKQAPGLESELTGYKSPYGSAWTEPKCK